MDVMPSMVADHVLYYARTDPEANVRWLFTTTEFLPFNTVLHDEQCLAQRFHVCIDDVLIAMKAHCLLSYNKYTQIAARAVRASLKEEQRVAAEKRGLTSLRYQQWENGQGGQQVRIAMLAHHEYY